MPLLQYTKQEVLRSKLVEPGKYQLEIGDFSYEEAKTKTSYNYVWDFVIVAPSFEGVPIRKTFNEKVISRMFPLLKTLGYEINESGGSLKLEAAELKGMKIGGKVQTGMNKDRNNEPFNDIVEFFEWK